jgi:hypothetical protein
MQIVFYKADGTKGFDPTIPVDARTRADRAAKVFTDAFVDPIKINIKVSFGPLLPARAWGYATTSCEARHLSKLILLDSTPGVKITLARTGRFCPGLWEHRSHRDEQQNERSEQAHHENLLCKLFDHLVGATKHLRRYVKAKFLGSSHIDDEHIAAVDSSLTIKAFVRIRSQEVDDLVPEFSDGHRLPLHIN